MTGVIALEHPQITRCEVLLAGNRGLPRRKFWPAENLTKPGSFLGSRHCRLSQACDWTVTKPMELVFSALVL